MCAVCGVASGSSAEDTWRRVTSSNFTVTGEAPEKDLRRAAEDLEAFRGALAKLYSATSVDSPVPTWVVMFKDQRRFLRYAPRDAHGRPFASVGGCFLPDPDINYIVFSRYDEEVDRRVVLHEYAHSVMHRTMGAIPLWLSEGLADFYSTFVRHPTLPQGILGKPPADLLAILRAKEYIGLNQIVMARETERVWEDRDLGPMFYAESWALVHYLLIGSPHAAPTNVPLFLSELARGIEPEHAFRTAFGETIDDVDVKLRRYVRQPDYGGIGLDASETRVAAVPAPPLRAAELHRVRGDLLLRVGSLQDAEKELTAALAADPSDVAARIGLARTKLATPRHDEALDALATLSAEAPGNFAAQYYFAVALTLRRRFDEAFLAFHRAVLLREGSASAWFGLSTNAVALGMDDTAEASLSRAMHLEFNPASYRNRAYAAFGFGRHEVVVTDARRFINAVGLQNRSAQDLAFLAAIAHWRERQPQQAASLLEDVRRASPPDSWNADLVNFLEGRTTAERLLAQARNQEQKTSAHTYIGLKATLDGRMHEALAHLRWVREEGVRGDADYVVAIEELMRIEASQLDLR